MSVFFEEVEMIQVKDGKLFDCEKKAADYITDKVSEEINEMLKTDEAVKINMSFNHLYKVILCLSGDLEKIKKLHEITSKYIND